MTHPTIGSPHEFERWLTARENKRVGYVARHLSCPLANWLTAVNGKRVAVFYTGGNAYATFSTNGCRQLAADVELPQLLSDFAEAVDTILEAGAVYGYQALSVLGDIMRDGAE